MKTRFIIIIVLCTLSLGYNSMFAQNDNESLEQININTRATAYNTKKGNYEYLTLGISSLTFFAAIITLIFTIRTYRSQKKTQENTTPIFTKEKQYEVLVSIAESLIDNLINAYEIKLKMQNSKNNSIPSELLFNCNSIDSSELHLELFYDDEKDAKDDYIENSNTSLLLRHPSKYSIMSSFKNMIDSYNTIYNTIASQVQEQIIDYETIKKEYNHYVIGEIIVLLRYLLYINVMVFETKMGKINRHIAQYIYYSMIRSLSDKAGIIGHYDGESTIQYEKELRIEKIKTEMSKKVTGINTLFDDTNTALESLYEAVYLSCNSYGLSNLDNTKIDFDYFLDMLRLCVYGRLNNQDVEIPSIKYKIKKVEPMKK